MSEGKGADDLGVFDDLLKGKSSEGSASPNAPFKGGTLPPPPVNLAGGLMAPVGRPSRGPTPFGGAAPPPPPSARASAVPGTMRGVPPPPQMAPPTPPPPRVSAVPAPPGARTSGAPLPPPN